VVGLGGGLVEGEGAFVVGLQAEGAFAVALCEVEESVGVGVTLR
jgi:hypothetical protein